MQLDLQFIYKINRINWFDNKGDLTSQLSIRSCKGLGREYQEWNKLVKEIKGCYIPNLEKIWNEKLSGTGLDKQEVLVDVRFEFCEFS